MTTRNARKWTRCSGCNKKFYRYELFPIGQLKINHRQLGYYEHSLFCRECLKNKNFKRMPKKDKIKSSERRGK